MALAPSPSTRSAGPVAVVSQTTQALAGAFPGLVNLGTTDPSAGAGIQAPIASLGMRNNAGVGQLWIKTGAANAAWTLQVTP